MQGNTFHICKTVNLRIRTVLTYYVKFCKPSIRLFLETIGLYSILFLLFSAQVNAAEIPNLDWQKYGFEPVLSQVPAEILKSDTDGDREKNSTGDLKKEKTEKAESEVRKQIDTSDVIRLKDEKGFEFTVKFNDIENPTDEMLQKLSKLKSNIESISLYKIRSLHFLYNPRALDAHVKIDSFQCGEDDYVSKIPAGIFFSQSDHLEYNFRLVREKFFIRIEGTFRDEGSICEKISSAIDNPMRYLNRNDPAFVSSRVEFLEKEIERLENESWNLKLSIIALHNSGFFSGPKPVDRVILNKILLIKKRNPHMSSDEIYDLVEKEGLDISRNEFELILRVFFPAE